MKMLKENCTLGKYDSIVAIMRIAVDYEYMDMESKTKMGCGSEASAGNNISCHSFLSETDYDHLEMYLQTGIDELSYFHLLFKVFLHFLNIRAITVSIIESGISAPLIMIMYEITMTIVADYDHMEIAITVSVETIDSEFSDPLHMLMDEIAVDYDHIKMDFQNGIEELLS
ncbi:hypothetical protein GIB67_021659 [Kingdonia uniflora]|uniref:Uncharacterized protein n=1 Tax=Kingdonia uniflora TaxID=39325 RepID=A0A7J7LFX4_9MAGN|nr:hypothetical protein GIB67_021659 [Kingdonia uniflora]